MKNIKRYYVLGIICSTLLIVVAVLLQGTKTSKINSEYFVQEKDTLERLYSNSSEIHRTWIEGEDSKEWGLIRDECLKEYGITKPFDESFLRCNPMLLVCYEKFYKKKNFHLVRSTYAFEDQSRLSKNYSFLSKSNNSHIEIKDSGYLFTLEDEKSKKTLDILLSSECHNVYLEQRAYAYGEMLEVSPKNETEDYRFDNFNRNIYIDQNLVMNFEINEWIDFGNPDLTSGLVKKTNNDLFLPAVKLTFDQMENYCAFRGKQLLLAHFFDAATFLPMNLDDKLPKNNYRSPYYFSKKKSDFKNDCKLIYAKECLKKEDFRLNSISPTWAGVNDSMGGVLEAFRNPIDPESNLKTSSFYFDFKSPWHKLGFRAGWDGDGLQARNFNFKGFNPEENQDKFMVGFRCMKEEKNQ